MVSGVYGAGEVISETDNTLTLRLLRGKTVVTVNKAGYLHYIPRAESDDFVLLPHRGMPTPHISSHQRAI